MKKSFRKLLSILLAAACLGGMFAAAADAPAVEDARTFEKFGEQVPANEEEYKYAEDARTFEKFEEAVPMRTGEYKYEVTIPAGRKATLPDWHPNLTKGTVVEIQALATTPGYTAFTFSLQSSNGGGFTYGITEGQTRRMTMPNNGEYTITFTSTKAVTALVKIVTDPK